MKPAAEPPGGEYGTALACGGGLGEEPEGPGGGSGDEPEGSEAGSGDSGGAAPRRGAGPRLCMCMRDGSSATSSAARGWWPPAAPASGSSSRAMLEAANEKDGLLPTPSVSSSDS